MATVEIIIRDDDGSIVNGSERRKYQLNLRNNSFNDIEGAIESFKNTALPDITADLLNEVQTDFRIGL